MKGLSVRNETRKGQISAQNASWFSNRIDVGVFTEAWVMDWEEKRFFLLFFFLETKNAGGGKHCAQIIYLEN
jgi:hypothetical protein